jgi:DNA modification methylase
MSHHITNHLIIQGDCIDGMKTVPSESVHCVVTSPPYYGLRDYGTATWEGGDPLCNHTISMDTKWNDPKRGTDVLRPEVAHRGGSSSHCHLCGATRIDQQIGLEESPDEYVARLVEVFREVRRILRHDGTVWLNLGDSYAGNNSQASNNGRAGYGNPRERVVNRISEGLKPKDLIGIPWRVAFALQADGWWLRQDIIWHKPNPMPESVSDRCTKSHEYIFLLTKSERYYYDKDAIAEPITDESALRYLRGVSDTHKNINGAPGQPPHSMNQARPNVRKAFTDDMGGGGTSFIGHSGYKKADGQIMIKENRNKRSVWTVATQPYPEAHFAVYPTKLIEPCILAGTSEKGCCATCGAPWKRVTEKTGEFQRRWSTNNAEGSPYESQGSMQNTYETVGWQPTCKCEINDPVPCTVFDPFTGSGTTGLVALTNNRMFVGTELNPEYVKIAEKRLSIVQPKLI